MTRGGGFHKRIRVRTARPLAASCRVRHCARRRSRRRDWS
jgi:hypothetical protein